LKDKADSTTQSADTDRRARVEQKRKESLAAHKKRWADLTRGDEWPESEHEARFEALLGIALNTPVIK
jgi:hypothetical protein